MKTQPYYRAGGMSLFLVMLIWLFVGGTDVSAQPVVAGELLVDLDAGDLPLGPVSVWPNRGSLADFRAGGNPGVMEVSGVRAVAFDGDDYFGGVGLGPVSVPSIEGSSARSIEAWAYQPVIDNEETLVAWGQRGGPLSTEVSLNYGSSGNFGAVTHWGALDADLGWGKAPTAAQWHYLVYTYDGAGTTRVYADGVEKNSEYYTPWLNTYAGKPIRIGVQNNSDLSPDIGDRSLTGFIARVRVHSDALSADDIRNNFAYGPPMKPTIRLSTGKAVFLEGSSFCTVDSGLALIDDALSWKEVNVGIANIQDGAAESLSATAHGAISSSDLSYSSTTGELTIAPPGGAPMGDFQAVLRTLTYNNTADPHDATPRQIEFVGTGIDFVNGDAATKLVRFAPMSRITAGQLLVDLRARDLPPGLVTTWTNIGTLGDFVASGDPRATNVDGVRAVVFDGNDFFGGIGLGPISTSSIEGNSARSIEVWINDASIGVEETLVAWGRRGDEWGWKRTNMSFNYGTQENHGAANQFFSLGLNLGWAGAPAAGRWHHLVYTHDGDGTSCVYADSVQKNAEYHASGLSTSTGTPIRIGVQNNIDLSPDIGERCLTAAIAVVRIHTGALSPDDVLINYACGIENGPPPTPVRRRSWIEYR